MSTENQESQQYPVDAIHIFPKDQKLVIEVEGGVSFSLRLTPEGLLASLGLNQAASERAAALKDDVVPASEASPLLKDTSSHLVENPSTVTAPAASATDSQPGANEAQEPDPPQPVGSTKMVLTGKLENKPEKGKYNDRQGNATAYARLQVHEDGRESALRLSTTFLRWTSNVALSLNKGDQITVEGFVNKSTDPSKLDRYSVYRFHNYPGRQASQKEHA